MESTQPIQREVAALVDEILAERDGRPFRDVVWVGAGGSNGGNFGAQWFVEHEATALRSSRITSNEFVHCTPAWVGPDTLCVAVSMRGTPETIEAARVAKEAGAATIAVYVDESGLTEVCDHAIRYQSLALDESRVERMNPSVVLMIAATLVDRQEDYGALDELLAAFDEVDGLYREAFRALAEPAAAWAEANSGSTCVNVLASGPAWGAGYVFSICNLQEMLQIDSPTIDACDFFHGPFEVLDSRASFFQLVGEGRNRPCDERAVAFLDRFGGPLNYRLDARDLGVDRLDESVREHFNHILFSPILNNVFMRALSATTGKDFHTRRYMWQMPY